jgi:hypothetical protein
MGDIYVRVFTRSYKYINNVMLYTHINNINHGFKIISAVSPYVYEKFDNFCNYTLVNSVLYLMS